MCEKDESTKMNSLLDSSESGISSATSTPRSRTSMPEYAAEDVSLEEIDSSDCLSSSPEQCRPNRSLPVREKERVKFFLCNKHGRQIRFYCNDCNVKGCVECIMKYHHSCTAELLRSITLKLCETSLQEDIHEFTTMNANLKNIRKLFDSKMSDIKKKIDLTADNIIEETERKRDQLKKKLLQVELDRHNYWIFQMELCQRSLKKLKSHLSRLRRLQLKDINSLRQAIFADIEGNLDFIEDGEIYFDFYDFSQYEFCKIQAPPCPRKSIVNLPEKSFSHRYNACTVIIRNILEEVVEGNYSLTASLQDAHLNTVYLTIQNDKNGTFKISYYPTKCGEYLLSVYLDFVAVGNTPYNVNVVFEESNLSPRPLFFIDQSGDGKLYKPWGICCDFRGRLLVTDRGNNCVKIFAEDGAFLGTFGKMGSGPGEFVRPTGIAVDRVLQRIIVSDKDNHRIQVFNIRGIYLLEFGSRGEENGQFNYPWDVSVSESSLIAVSDSKNCRVQLFDQRGGFIRKFSFKSHEMTDIELPRGLKFRTDGSLMVTDFNKHRIVVLSDGFEAVKGFGEEGTDLARFLRPQSIDIDRVGRFAVADCRNHRIQVFKPTGELFCAFGSQGSKPGEVDAPQGICILPSNRIAVVELNNNRVQVFELPKEAEN